VVARVRKLTGEPKVGHGGTLDPLASGVLPVFLGKATRLQDYLMQYPKTYRASVALGVSTDSYDAEGAVTAHGDVSAITQEVIQDALRAFRGVIKQTPPEYSALKHNGQPLYKLAREGRSVEVQSRLTTIYRLEMLEFTPSALELEVECSKGTYIRSLAHELGQALGCGAHVSGLVRISYGPFDINQALSLESLEKAALSGDLSCLVQPMDSVLARWPKVVLLDAQVEMVCYGEALELQMPADFEHLRAYDTKGCFIAMLEYDSEAGVWHPKKVFR